VRKSWRSWLPGAKNGTARGVAVWGSPGFRHDGEQIADLLAHCRSLRPRAAAHGVTLDGDPDSLAALDRFLDPMTQNDRHALQIDGGLYLGTAMVRHLPGVRWHLWPNGHPVVKLASGREVDVVAIVRDLADAGQLRLAALYADAAADS
jgi:hypothetical protein